jgi:hypothetical protein
MKSISLCVAILSLFLVTGCGGGGGGSSAGPDQTIPQNEAPDNNPAVNTPTVPDTTESTHLIRDYAIQQYNVSLIAFDQAETASKKSLAAQGKLNSGDRIVAFNENVANQISNYTAQLKQYILATAAVYPTDQPVLTKFLIDWYATIDESTQSYIANEFATYPAGAVKIAKDASLSTINSAYTFLKNSLIAVSIL